ncbi:hypothetical protein HK102_013406 [Quaeritorhiza haematococci]|nr:hypothetical protein HK102_013406 [Quaeritorhiza haematococci]
MAIKQHRQQLSYTREKTDWPVAIEFVGGSALPIVQVDNFGNSPVLRQYFPVAAEVEELQKEVTDRLTTFQYHPIEDTVKPTGLVGTAMQQREGGDQFSLLTSVFGVCGTCRAEVSV